MDGEHVCVVDIQVIRKLCQHKIASWDTTPNPGSFQVPNLHKFARNNIHTQTDNGYFKCSKSSY